MTGWDVRWVRAGMAVGCLALAVSGCSSLGRPRPGDGSFDAGDWHAAAAAYEARLAGGGDASDEEALKLRLALAKAASADTAEELELARELLEQLRSSPDLVGWASALIAILDRQRLLEERLAATARTEVSLQASLEDREHRIAELEEAVAEAGHDVAAQRAVVEELRAALERVREELEELKRIDLEMGPS